MSWLSTKSKDEAPLELLAFVAVEGRESSE